VFGDVSPKVLEAPPNKKGGAYHAIVRFNLNFKGSTEVAPEFLTSKGALQPIDFKVGPLGLEPRTKGL